MKYTVSLFNGKTLQYMRVLKAGRAQTVAFGYARRVEGFPFRLIIKTFIKIYIEKIRCTFIIILHRILN